MTILRLEGGVNGMVQPITLVLKECLPIRTCRII